MRRLPAAIVLVGLLVCGAAPATAQKELGIAPTGTEGAPAHAYRLTLPEQRVLGQDQLRVDENGTPVRDFSLTSVGEGGGRDFGAVLVIDASDSMRGNDAIDSAIEAARALVSERTATQSIGVVTFNSTPTVVLEPTNDQTAIDAALDAPPPLGPQTHVYDAVETAVDLLEQAGITAGSILLLSDGADTGSQATGASVASRAARAQVRIYTVGLRSRAFDPQQLQVLASATQGDYFRANSVDDLSQIFRGVGAQLASEYIVRYRSSPAPGSQVTVAVRVDGVPGIATSTYRSAGTAGSARATNFWTSTLGTVLTVLLCALLLALSFAIVLVRRWRGPGVRERIGDFVSTHEETPPAASNPTTIGGFVAGTERSLERTQWWAGFKEDAEIGRIEMQPVRLVTFTAAATLLTMYIFASVTGSIAAAVPVALAAPVALRAYVRAKRDKQRREFSDQLPDVLQSAASAIRAGHGLVGALSMVVEDAPEPSKTEFGRVVADEQLGVPLDEALRVVQQRMDSRDVQQLALVAQIQRETGGNTAEVLDRVTEALRQRAELRRMVRGLTAQGRLSRWVVTALPVVLLLFITVANYSYVEPLYTTTLGVVLLLVGLGSMTLGSLAIKKIVDFEI